MQVPVLLVPARSDVEPVAGVRTVPLPGDHDLHAQRPVDVANLLVDHVENGFLG
jgi:hypothetical protein